METREPARPRIVGRLFAISAAALLALSFSAPATAATSVNGTGLELLARLATAPEHPSGYVRGCSSIGPTPIATAAIPGTRS
jgi:hypothetical protein